MSVTIIPDIGHIVLGCIICAMAIRGYIVEAMNRQERNTLTKKLMAQDGSLHSYVAGEEALKDIETGEISIEQAHEVLAEAEEKLSEYDTLPVE